MTLPTFTLEQADGLIAVRTSPAGAGVTLDGVFQGESPIELAVKSSTRYRIQVFKAGYQPVERTLSVASGEEKDVVLSLRRQMGDVVVTVDPAAALLYINGESRGNANQKITLPTEPHDLSIRLEGYAGYDTEITPKSGLTQEVKVRLLTLEEARLAALKPRITTSASTTSAPRRSPTPSSRPSPAATTPASSRIRRSTSPSSPSST